MRRLSILMVVLLVATSIFAQQREKTEGAIGWVLMKTYREHLGLSLPGYSGVIPNDRYTVRVGEDILIESSGLGTARLSVCAITSNHIILGIKTGDKIRITVSLLPSLRKGDIILVGSIVGNSRSVDVIVSDVNEKLGTATLLLWSR